MDDLKQSVQNAVYEQKDPLLIYKFEGFELFKKLIARINEDTVSFLTKADLPVQNPDELSEATPNRRRSGQRYSESKEESRSLLQGGGGGEGKTRPPIEKPAPRKTEQLPGRNERVTVQYTDGTVKKDVKFKTVEEDVIHNRCVIV
jgi:preprotein translocase subunit SecA